MSIHDINARLNRRKDMREKAERIAKIEGDMMMIRGPIPEALRSELDELKAWLEAVTLDEMTPKRKRTK